MATENANARYCAVCPRGSRLRRRVRPAAPGAEYDLQPQPNGDTLLHLSSQERLSTDFNLYAALWSDAVMSDMQNNILHVVRNRCEAQARTEAASITINNKGN